MFFENLNAFMAWLVTLALFVGGSVNIFLLKIANFICPTCKYPELLKSSLYVGAFTLILGVCWYKKGLVPTVILLVFASSFSKIIFVVSMFTPVLILPVLIAYPIGLLMICTAGFGNKELNQNN